MQSDEDRLRAALTRPARPSSDFDLNPAIALPPGRLLRPAAVLVPVWLVMRGVQMLGASVAAQVGMVGPLSTIWLASWFLDEPVTARLMLGTGTVLLGMGDTLSLAQALLGIVWMAVGLTIIGSWLENRPTAKRLEVLRLLLNLPVVWLALQLGLLTAQPLLWALLLGYSLLSVGALFWTPRGHTPVPA